MMDLRRTAARTFLQRCRHDFADIHYDEARAASPETHTQWLNDTLRYAAQEVPFYADLLRQNRISVCDLSTWPILSRTDVRDNFARLRAPNYCGKAVLVSTSGSTGKPLTVVQDKAQRDWSRAAEHWFNREQMRVEPLTTSKVVLWNAPHRAVGDVRDWKKRVHHWLTRTHVYTPTMLTEELLNQFVIAINQHRPELVKGYAWALYQLALHIQKRGISIHSPRVVHSTAEMMRPFMRDAIEGTMRTRVLDGYGCREIGNVAGECESGNYHVFSFAVHLEVVNDDGQPVLPGETGRVLLTTLHNRAMPLIRYEIGDMAIPATSCTCGSHLPVLHEVKGRLLDYFKKSDGTLVDSGMFLQFFYQRPWLSEFQLLQTGHCEIQIFIVPISSIPEGDKRDIEKQISYYMGTECRYVWHEVAELPPTPGGKFLYVRSTV